MKKAKMEAKHQRQSNDSTATTINIIIHIRFKKHKLLL